jgi:hypothetical protein
MVATTYDPLRVLKLPPRHYLRPPGLVATTYDPLRVLKLRGAEGLENVLEVATTYDPLRVLKLLLRALVSLSVSDAP